MTKPPDADAILAAYQAHRLTHGGDLLGARICHVCDAYARAYRDATRRAAQP